MTRLNIRLNIYYYEYTSENCFDGERKGRSEVIKIILVNWCVLKDEKKRYQKGEKVKISHLNHTFLQYQWHQCVYNYINDNISTHHQFTNNYF